MISNKQFVCLKIAAFASNSKGRERGMAVDILRIEKHDGIIFEADI